MHCCTQSPNELSAHFVLAESDAALIHRCRSRRGSEEKVLTYAQFALSAISLAKQLATKPLLVGKGTKVAILVEKSVDWLTAILACNLLGAPFTLFDTRNKLEQRKHVWRTWRPAVVICRWVLLPLDDIFSSCSLVLCHTISKILEVPVTRMALGHQGSPDASREWLAR